MKKKFIGLCAIMLLASGCGKIPTLEDGKEAIVTFENGDKISVDEYYDKIKDSYGLQTLITMVDTYITEHEFKDYKDKAKKNAEAYIKAFIEQYDGKDKFLEALQSQTSYQTIEAYQDYLYLSSMQSHAIDEYAKLQIKDEDIKKYYDEKFIGDMEVSHILITSDATSSSTDEDKKKAEEAAKKTVQEIIDKLNTAKKNGEDITKTFENLAKEYSKDDNTKDKGGALGKINYGDLSENYDELISAAEKLKDGEYSTSVITTELGYHVVLKTKSYEKDKYDDAKDEIKETLGKKYVTDNQNSIGLTALQHYRKQYGMEIQDDEIKKQYSNYINNALASIANANNSSNN